MSQWNDPDSSQLDAAKALGAPVVELHTGAYCEAYWGGGWSDQTRAELARIVAAAAHAEAIGLECHAGHGLTFDTVGPVAEIQTLTELNIGHFLIGEAIFDGLETAIRKMRGAMDRAREGAAA